jgi:hypothetical protein
MNSNPINWYGKPFDKDSEENQPDTLFTYFFECSGKVIILNIFID